MDSKDFILITGPMFSGKTEELLRIANRYQIAGKHILVLKPKKDKRYGENVVVTHDNNGVAATEIISLLDVFPLLENHRRKYDAIFIDEFQFLQDVDIDLVRDIVEVRGISLYVSGLVLDSFREPFSSMVKILPYANILQLNAVCNFCGGFSAKYTYRKTKSDESQILIGGKNLYSAICLDCLLKREVNDKKKQ